ncbi:MAG: hypothetical protein HOP31_05630 [Ignavibacteria bacterium]|nr:hypothetical protein [Ignavibacteria bacterium]
MRSFSPEELTRFGEFLNSPYFNTNNRVTKLFGELKKHYPEFMGKGVDKEVIYKKLFPGKPFNEQVLKNINSEFLKLEKLFLSVNNYIKDPFIKYKGLVNELINRNIDTLFEKESKSYEEEIRNSDVSFDKLCLNLFYLEEHRFTNNMINNRQELVTGNIEKSGEYLTIYYLNNILRFYVNNSINKFSFNSDIEVNFPEIILKNINMDELIHYMESHNIEYTLNIKLAYFCMLCIKDVNDDVIYNKFKTLLFNNINNLKRDEAHANLHFMESICAQKINSGKAEFYKDLFETYVHEIDNNIYNPHEHSPLTVMKYRNIYLSAIRVGEFSWAENFINEFKKKLQKEDRQNIVSLAMAQLEFEKEEYESTLEYLKKISTDQLFYKVDVKILSLRSLYELGHYETAISTIESFRRMLNSNTSLTEQYRKKNLNFISALNILIKAKMDNDPEGLTKAAEKIRAYDMITNRNWLLEKSAKLN